MTDTVHNHLGMLAIQTPLYLMIQIDSGKTSWLAMGDFGHQRRGEVLTVSSLRLLPEYYGRAVCKRAVYQAIWALYTNEPEAYAVMCVNVANVDKALQTLGFGLFVDTLLRDRVLNQRNSTA